MLSIWKVVVIPPSPPRYLKAKTTLPFKSEISIFPDDSKLPNPLEGPLAKVALNGVQVAVLTSPVKLVE